MLEIRRSSDTDATDDTEAPDDSMKIAVQRGRLTGLADDAPTYQGENADGRMLRNSLARTLGQMHQ